MDTQLTLKAKAKHNDDLSLDYNDYEHIQEEYGIQSEDVQPIALDRFVERIGKSRRSYLDNSDSDEPCIYLRHDKPFALKDEIV